MKVLIIYKSDSRAGLLAQILADELQGRGAEPVVQICAQLTSENCPQADLIFVLGGDGTLLKTARFYAVQGTPILGVNMGSVGFLSCVEPEDLLKCIDSVLEKKYEIEERLMIDVSVMRNQTLIYHGLALNDLVIKTVSAHTIRVGMKLDGRPYASYLGDGIICATPTGSTAYSYSAGGPVVDSSLEAHVITPLCPQLSINRPVVVNATSRLEFAITAGTAVSISLDAEECFPVVEGDLLLVRRSELVTNLIRLSPVRYFDKIQRKRNRVRRTQSGDYSRESLLFR